MSSDTLRRMLALAYLAVASSCTGAPTAPDERFEICWADFVQLDGVRYLGTFPRAGRGLDESDLGPRIAVVKFRLEGNVHDINYRAKDGDAAFLEPGTPLYSLKGYTPITRIAARIGSGLRLYEADYNPRATTGADFLDLAQKVDSIGIFDDDLRPLAAITQPAEVDSLVRWAVDAQIRPPTPGSSLRYFLAFYFKDGQGAVRLYYPEQNQLAQWLAPAAGFRTTLQTAVARSANQSWPGIPPRSEAEACSLSTG